MDERFDVVIVGGGVGGALRPLARRAHRAGAGEEHVYRDHVRGEWRRRGRRLG